jgi:hypothetical protein
VLIGESTRFTSDLLYSKLHEKFRYCLQTKCTSRVVVTPGLTDGERTIQVSQLLRPNLNL